MLSNEEIDSLVRLALIWRCKITYIVYGEKYNADGGSF